MRRNLPRTPSLRNFDLYRLVVVRGLRQIAVARVFGIAQSSVCRALIRVRDWVDWTTEPCLFRDRHDRRFYAALGRAGYRVRECSDPYIVIIEHTRGFPFYGRSTTGDPEAEIAAMQNSASGAGGKSELPSKLQSNLPMQKELRQPEGASPRDGSDANRSAHSPCVLARGAADGDMRKNENFAAPTGPAPQAGALDLHVDARSPSGGSCGL